jgi:hypothetical protein
VPTAVPQTFGGEATFETRHDAHNADTFGEAAQNESIDDAANDEVRGVQLAWPCAAPCHRALPAAQLGVSS